MKWTERNLRKQENSIFKITEQTERTKHLKVGHVNNFIVEIRKEKG